MIREDSLRVTSAAPVLTSGALWFLGAVFALLIAVQGRGVAAEAQPLSQAPESAAQEPAKKKYTLEITTEGITEISLEAEDVMLAQVAADLSRHLKARVIVGPGIQGETITMKFTEVVLEPALRLLAPRVYIDYEIRKGAQPSPKGIYLLGYGDPEPSVNAVVQGGSQGLLITGHTEDAGEPSVADALQVHRGDRDRITIISRQEPLAAVVMAIGDALGVPAEVRYDALETVDADIIDRRLDDAIPGISPNIRLYVRVDVNRSTTTPLRIVLVPAEG